jgi:hypothetical protein
VQETSSEKRKFQLQKSVSKRVTVFELLIVKNKQSVCHALLSPVLLLTEIFISYNSNSPVHLVQSQENESRIFLSDCYKGQQDTLHPRNLYIKSQCVKKIFLGVMLSLLVDVI